MQSVMVERLQPHPDQEGYYLWVREKVEMPVEEDVSVDETSIEKELSRQATLAYQYGSLASELQAELSRKDDEVKRMYAFVATEIRSKKEKENKRTTKDEIEANTILDERYQDALVDMQTTRAFSKKADSWYRAIHAKKDVIVAITYRQNAELKGY